MGRGDGRARERLVEEHLPMVRALAAQTRKQLSPRIEVDDLVAYGVQGLMEAAARFDDRPGNTFATFAYHRIRGAMYDGVRQMGHLKRRDYARLKVIERAHEYVENLADRAEGAAATGNLPPPTVDDDVHGLHDALQGVVATFVASLECLVEEGHEFLDEDQLPIDDVLAMKQMGGRVRGLLGRLPEKERHFIEKHYFEGKTLLDAGAELGLSKSWASRLHARAIDLLHRELARSP